MIVENSPKDLIGQVLVTATGAPKLTGTIYCMVRLELDGDADDGKYWDTDSGGSWKAYGSVISWPEATHLADADWLYQLPAAASNGKAEGTGRYRFTDDTTGAATSVFNGGGEHSIVEAFSVWDEAESNHGAAGTFGKRLRLIVSDLLHEGTAAGPGVNGNEIDLDAAASSVDGAYDPAMITIVDGTGKHQSRGIFEYIGSLRRCVVDRDWKVLPDNTSKFQVHAWAGREHVNEGQLQAGTKSVVTLNALASDQDDVYNDQFVFLRSGAGQDQVGHIKDYDGTTKEATLHHPLAVAPDDTTAYAILPQIFHEWEQRGANTVTFQVVDDGALPVPNSNVHVYNTDGSVLLETKTTDINGESESYLESGTYLVKVTPPAGYTSASKSVVITTDQTEQIEVVAQVPPASADPTLCRFTGFLRDASGTVHPNAVINIRASIPQYNTDTYTKRRIQITSDSNGAVDFELEQAALVEVTSVDAGHDETQLTVPSLTAKDFGVWLNGG
jgi:hypothetical protein